MSEPASGLSAAYALACERRDRRDPVVDGIPVLLVLEDEGEMEGGTGSLEAAALAGLADAFFERLRAEGVPEGEAAIRALELAAECGLALAGAGTP